MATPNDEEPRSSQTRGTGKKVATAANRASPRKIAVPPPSGSANPDTDMKPKPPSVNELRKTLEAKAPDGLCSLLKDLKDHGYLSNPRAEVAMLAVDRADFVLKEHAQRMWSYWDRPLPIGYDVTISAPHMHASALCQLSEQLKPGMTALDVGSGSGYLSAAMAHMVGETGKVVGVEVVQELVKGGIANVKKNHEDLLTSKRLQIVETDGHWGWEQDAPYNAIHVGAAPEELPQALVDQLAKGGRMVIPVGPQGQGQTFLRVDKDANGKVTKTKLFSVRYVPLIKKTKQKPPVNEEKSNF